MSADEYVPSEDEMRHAYRKTRLLDHHADVFGAFDRFLARVRRDAAREALDGLAEWADLRVREAVTDKGADDWRRTRFAVISYRDTHCPEEAP